MFFQLLCAAAKQQKAAFRPTKIADQQNYRDRQGYHSRIYRKFCYVSSDEDDVGVNEVEYTRKSLIEEEEPQKCWKNLAFIRNLGKIS